MRLSLKKYPRMPRPVSKQTIAIDIDDVLAANAEGFIEFTNRRWGTNLTVEDYDEHWAKVWQVSGEEELKRVKAVREAALFSSYRHFPEAEPVLRRLAKRFKLVVLTSRQRAISGDTFNWIDRHFKGIFSEIHFTGIWDGLNKDSHVRIRHTKANLASDIEADYLIDDQLKHCLAAAEAEIEALLFGNYAWNRMKRLPPRVTRVNDWSAVREYFDAQNR